MAFSADELRVLRRALANALHPSPASDEDVKDCLRLAHSVDEAIEESARLHAFLVADLGRYRAALPGSAPGYLPLLADALSAGHRPGPDDLAALRALRGNPVAAALLDRCRDLAEHAVRARFAGRPVTPAPRTRLLALQGGRTASGKPAERPAPRPPERPVPTPAEVFPPKRRPAPQRPAGPPQKLAAG
ncbi:hypothetical protein [Streptomyces tsukubensis]|uniref:Uncharacterized protein n=1 Tax=Streptomyces tsukubensis TaxID=83656 RepID=A0A1V3ZZQ6_9ACTN|nr:hypothetical protein [Streptomyces tsukubensis]OON71664.1 hypothetical protein B1H18_33040 [Streptomyces tsukubensis]QFR97912.1 hypothetical protein GBW32_21115 [Streptomyces tsukubensis]